MGQETIYPVLAGQKLTSMLIFDAWHAPLPPSEKQGCAPLYGAVALYFERHVLLCCSPVRYSSLPESVGAFYGLADGRMVSLGFRATLYEQDEVDTIFPAAYRLPLQEHWRTSMPSTLPIIGEALEGMACIYPSQPKFTNGWIEMRFRSGQHYHISYRPELDSSIEVAAKGIRHRLDFICVEDANQAFGWLHPVRLCEFVLDQRLWKSARPVDWPMDIQRQWRCSDAPDAFYHRTMRRVLLAYFRQNACFRHRLLALRFPVRCKGIPDGLIEEVAAELLAESIQVVSPRHCLLPTHSS